MEINEAHRYNSSIAQGIQHLGNMEALVASRNTSSLMEVSYHSGCIYDSFKSLLRWPENIPSEKVSMVQTTFDVIKQVEEVLESRSYSDISKLEMVAHYLKEL